MNPEDRYREIARRLLAKAHAQQVEWRKEPQCPNSYLVDLPKGRIKVFLRTPSADPDFISLVMYASDGVEIDRWKVEEGTDDWNLVYELYTAAHRAAIGWDTALREIEKSLAQEGPVGVGR
jgi:hypothetical protein